MFSLTCMKEQQLDSAPSVSFQCAEAATEGPEDSDPSEATVCLADLLSGYGRNRSLRVT